MPEILLVGVAMWLWVSVGLALLGGWRRLARAYPAGGPAEGDARRSQSLYLRFGANYSGVVTLRRSAAGLRLSVFPLFRLGHPPLLVPWSDVEEVERRQRPFPRVRLRFARVPGVPLLVTPALADWILEGRVAATVGGSTGAPRTWTPPAVPIEPT